MYLMKIGIRYCGGCNPSYDRKLYVEKLKHLYTGYQIEAATETNHYDYLIIVSGCMSCCASFSQFHFKKLIKIVDVHTIPKL